MLDVLARVVRRSNILHWRHAMNKKPQYRLHVDELMRFRRYFGLRATVLPALAESDRAVLVLPNKETHEIPFRSHADHSTIDYEALIEPSQPVEMSALHLRTEAGTHEFPSIGVKSVPGDEWRAMTDRFFARAAKRAASLAVLELGSRRRQDTADSARQAGFARVRDYVGFDILPGENVDVVGDAHELSKHFGAGRFDIVYSDWVFEHLLMPWKVVIEANRVLKTGGELFINTNHSIGLHDLPWDFWRYSDTSWHGLLNEATGFEILEARMGDPVRLTPMRYHSGFREHEGGLGFQASAVWARKIADTALSWDVPSAGLLAKLSRAYPKELKDAPPQAQPPER